MRNETFKSIEQDLNSLTDYLQTATVGEIVDRLEEVTRGCRPHQQFILSVPSSDVQVTKDGVESLIPFLDVGRDLIRDLRAGKDAVIPDVFVLTIVERSDIEPASGEKPAGKIEVEEEAKPDVSKENVKAK